MCTEILTEKQRDLLDWIAQYQREYYLVGGTAIALYLGHRQSVDFDMFKQGTINHKRNLERLSASGFAFQVTRRVAEQMNCLLNDVKLTFFQYPFDIPAAKKEGVPFRLPALLDLAAMKAYALGRRSKWKDYVDLYFILTEHYTMEQICARATEIFGELFSEKMFRAQLSYFDDIDYSEEVDYIIANPPTDDEIKARLVEISIAGV